MTTYSRAKRPPGVNPLWARFQSSPPTDWTIKSVGELGKDSKGKLPRDLQDTPSEGTKPYLLIEGLLTGIPQGYTRESGLPECNESDTVLVADGSRSGLALRGRCGVLGSTLLIYRALPAVDDGFLFYLIESLYEFLNKAPTGGAIPHLDQDLLARLKVLTPKTREEQTRIAETLKAADDHIRALEEQIHKAERVKKALIRDLFTKGTSNVSRRAYQKSEIGSVPSDWIVAPLAKICGGPDCVKTGPFGAQLPPEVFSSSGVRMLNITDIGDGEVVWKSDFYVTEDVFERLREYELCEGDIAFSRVADVGRLACIRKELEPLLMSSNCIRLRAKTAFNAKFLTHAFQDAESVSRQVVAMSNAGGRPIVTPRFLRQIKVPCPPIEEQNEIAMILEHAEALVSSVKSQLTAARRVKQSLLQNLLTGKIRLKA